MVSFYIIIKYVGCSTLLCAFIAWNIFEYVITKVDKLIWNFISDYKPDKPRRDVDPLCRKQKMAGGIGVPNIKNILYAQHCYFEQINEYVVICPKFVVL